MTPSILRAATEPSAPCNLAVPTVSAVPRPASGAVQAPHDDIAIGRLRAAVTLLVIAHHSVLAYHPATPLPPASLVAQPRLWEAFPVSDPAHAPLFGLFTGWNDTFFMALMFFLSGLFVWSTLRRKGTGEFLRGRALRLGLPFVAAAALLAPLAYVPSYLQTPGAHSASGFFAQWLHLGDWPAGPAWFLWVLLAFDGVAALVLGRFPEAGERLSRLGACARERPAAFFALLLSASAAAYIPLSLAVGPFGWSSFGPFFVQTSRILHYAAYFLCGIAAGACGLGNGLAAPGGRLARRWALWTAAAFVAFAVDVVVFLIAISPQAAGAPKLWGTVGGFGFVLACATSSFALLALFARFARERGQTTDSLRRNAYGMYLVHYPIVSWLQLALLGAALPALAKGTLVTASAIALSWAAAALLRRIPGVARVV